MSLSLKPATAGRENERADTCRPSPMPGSPMSAIGVRRGTTTHGYTMTCGAFTGEEGWCRAGARERLHRRRHGEQRLATCWPHRFLAQPLNLEQSHLSVHGHAGTLRYMAPETVQPTMDCRRQLSKRVDIWALGMMLFQMLHNGRTPFDRFFTKGHIEAAVAIASKVVHTEVIKFDRAGLWAAERSLSWQQGNFFSSDIASPSCV